jgi:hypothetical protein
MVSHLEFLMGGWVCEKDKVTENKGKMDKIAQIGDG